jgi:ATP-dependent Lon protease
MLRTRPTTPDKDANKRDIAIYEGLLKAGPWRRVALPRDWRDRLDALASEMQHFSAVLTFIAQRLALAELSGAPLVPPPILLLGEPGVGKTHFTHRLAEILGTPVHRECFDNAEASSGLRGSSRYWGNTHYGALFRLIALGKHANPIVLLDEIDKSRPNGHGRNPSDALLTLLEPVSNARVKDESVELEMDCSHVWYIATANNPTHIPGPLRSRFSEFAIGEPDIDGRLALAHAIFSGTLERLLPKHSQRAHFRPLTDLQICRLAWHTPRQIRMAVENAIGAAALERRWHLEDRDFDDALQKRPMPGGATASSGRRGKGDPGDGVAIVLLPV